MARSTAAQLTTASTLVQLCVETADGHRLGRVFDLCCSWQAGRACVVDEVFCGSSGLLERLGFTQSHLHAVPWSRVQQLEHDVIVVARGG